MWYRENISSIFSSISEANASEILENVERNGSSIVPDSVNEGLFIPVHTDLCERIGETYSFSRV